MHFSRHARTQIRQHRIVQLDQNLLFCFSSFDCHEGSYGFLTNRIINRFERVAVGIQFVRTQRRNALRIRQINLGKLLTAGFGIDRGNVQFAVHIGVFVFDIEAREND